MSRMDDRRRRMRMMEEWDTEEYRSRKNAKMGLTEGIVGIGFGILWTVFAAAITSTIDTVTFNSPALSVIKIIFPGFGILFIIAIAARLIKDLNSKSDDEGQDSSNTTTDKPMTGAEKDELVNRIVSEVKKTQAPRNKAEKWACAYCGTLVDGEVSICPACGAGRKK